MPTLMQQAMGLLVGEQPIKPQSTTPKQRSLNKLTERQLIKLESEIGRTIFGEIPKGRTREFFCLDADTWVWHETWKDENNKEQERTVRYEIHSNGILKIENNGKNCNMLKGEELMNLTLAARMYHEKVLREIYKRDPHSGKLLNS